MLPTFWAYPSLRTTNIELDDLLAVFAKSKLISDTIDFTKLPSQDARAIQNILRDKPALQISVQDFVIERAKDPSQSLEEILHNLTPGLINNILKTDLTINLLSSYLKKECTIEDIATITMQYVTIMMINRTNAAISNHSDKYTLTLINANIDDPRFNLIVNNFLKEVNHETSSNCEQLALSVKKYPQLNRVIRIDGNLANILEHACYRLGIVFNNDYLGLNILPFHTMNELFLTARFNHDAMCLFPVFCCYDLEIFENLSFNRKHTYRPVTIPCLLDKNLRQLFYGASTDSEYPLYNNPHGLLDMTKAHRWACKIVGVFEHDMFHLVQSIKTLAFRGFLAGQRKLCFYAMKNMLTDNRFKAQKKFITKLLDDLIDDSAFFPLTENQLFTELAQPNSDKYQLYTKILNIFLEIANNPGCFATLFEKNHRMIASEKSLTYPTASLS